MRLPFVRVRAPSIQEPVNNPEDDDQRPADQRAQHRCHERQDREVCVAAIGAGADAVLAASVFHDGDDTVSGIKQHMMETGLAVRI